ncbi:MAG: AAA family ATPase [Myxococcales bacterium]|nr:AAA family ATPase [Myxococcales bacterium]
MTGSDGAFYTMEYLLGDDLHLAAPMGYREACALLRDVCSALCLVHSRRLVHRDVSPRNVLRVGAMRAKLIDFGALSPMGPSRQIVGTPPFCPPEVLHREPLDARADLYSLGATLYYALCGRNAYPARDFRSLRRLWESPPRAPSQLAQSIPATLDALVMELIQLDPSERPDSAAEVMLRLTSIAGLPVSEQVTVSGAYLVTPNLVGRDHFLTRFRRRLRRAQQGHGRALSVTADRGLGRTRALDACALEVKLAGGSLARADCLDAQQGDYGVARALCQQLFELHPQAAHRAAAADAALLATVVPELAAGSREHPSEPATNPGCQREAAEEPGRSLAPSRADLQRALRDFLLTLCAHRPLALVVDDVDEIDEPSTALLALLASAAAEHRLTLLTSNRGADIEEASPSLRLLMQHSKPMPIGPLSEEHCRALLGSVFGATANLELVAFRLHQVSGGNPRDLMQLVEHLVDRGIAHYAEGAWTLPAKIDPADLPDSLANAMADRVAGLSAHTRAIGAALALTPSDRWSAEECQQLEGGDAPRAAVQADLDALTAAGIASCFGEAYGLSQAGWVVPLLADVDAEAQSATHHRIATLFEAKGETFRMCQHLLRAGDHARALDGLVAFARQSKAHTSTNEQAYTRFLAGLPSDFEDSYRQAIDLCTKLGRPAADAYALQTRLSSALQNGPRAWDVFEKTLKSVERDAGLDFLVEQEQHSSLEPALRIKRSLSAAQQRYERLGSEEVVFAPTEALRELATVTVEGLGIAANCNDRRAWERMPSLSALAPLSPGFVIADWIRHAIGERLAGRILPARAAYNRILDRLSEPDQGGLGPTTFTSTRDVIVFSRGILDSLFGHPDVLRVVDAWQGDGLAALAPLQLRMLHYLAHGDGDKSDGARRDLECAAVQADSNPRQEGAMLVAELVLLSTSNDLVRLRRLVPHIERWARRTAHWRPALQFALGEQRRIAGDFAAAMSSHRRGLMDTRAGDNAVWPLLAGSFVSCLVSLGRTTEAVDYGRRYVAEAEASNLDILIVHIKMPLALALARVGELEAARAVSGEVTTYLESQGADGMPLATARMAQARVCLVAGNSDGFETAVQRCSPFFEGCTTRSLIASYKQLLRDGRRAAWEMRSGTITAADFDVDAEAVVTHLATAFETCQTLSERAQLVATILSEYCSSDELFFYVPSDRGAPELVAVVGSGSPPPGLIEWVTTFLAVEAGDVGDVTATATDDEAEGETSTLWECDRGRWFFPTLVGHRSAAGFVITGVAMVKAGPGREVTNAERLASELSRIGLDVADGPRTLVATAG